MDVIKKNPFILITIITIAAALFGVGKQIFDSSLLSLPPSSVTTHSENLQQMQDMQSELAELKKTENPSEHQVWYMGHLEKSIAHIKKYTPQPSKINPALSSQIKNLILVGTMLVFGVIGAIFHYSKRAKRQPPKGFNHRPNRIRPFDDPVARNTHWQSASTLASNFPTQKLLQTSSGYKVVMSTELFLICQCLIFMGLLPILADHLLTKTTFLDDLMSAYGVLILVGIALWVGLTLNTTKIDTQSRTIANGKHRYSFNQIHALQVITSLAGGRGHGIYKNYELNLVFKDGTRINLLNHGGEAEFESQTESLRKVFNVPVWEA